MSKILVVDDDKKILEVLKEMLTQENYEVVAREYIEEFNLKEFEGIDLILLDIMMPVFDGFEILKQIKYIISCPVIFLSAKSGEDSKVRGLMEGADDYITKPFSKKELIARINVALRRNLAIKENKVTIDDLTFDLNSNSILFDNGMVTLTKNEFRI